MTSFFRDEIGNLRAKLVGSCSHVRSGGEDHRIRINALQNIEEIPSEFQSDQRLREKTL